MPQQWTDLSKWAKHGVAMVLFVGALIGGGAIALSLLAASITALSGAGAGTATVPVVVAASAGTNRSAGSGTQATGQPFGTFANANASSTARSTSSLPGSSTPATTVNSESAVIDRINQQLDHMHSPIGATIDTGGVVVGNQIGKTFGHLLAGLMQTLFVEQNNNGQ